MASSSVSRYSSCVTASPDSSTTRLYASLLSRQVGHHGRQRRDELRGGQLKGDGGAGFLQAAAGDGHLLGGQRIGLQRLQRRLQRAGQQRLDAFEKLRVQRGSRSAAQIVGQIVGVKARLGQELRHGKAQPFIADLLGLGVDAAAVRQQVAGDFLVHHVDGHIAPYVRLRADVQSVGDGASRQVGLHGNDAFVEREIHFHPQRLAGRKQFGQRRFVQRLGDPRGDGQGVEQFLRRAVVGRLSAGGEQQHGQQRAQEEGKCFFHL